jgi:hypothetical protein
VARVIAGEAGGRRLAVPGGRDTRPTSDRAREGLFATIVSMLGSLDGARVLDLYAGSGAVGLEALSRGAEHVLLVEHGARAARVIRENIEAIGLPGAVLAADRVERVLARGPAPAGAMTALPRRRPGTAPKEAGTTWCSPTRRTRWRTPPCRRSCRCSSGRAGWRPAPW